MFGELKTQAFISFAALAAATSSTQIGTSLLLTLIQPFAWLKPNISTSTCCWRRQGHITVGVNIIDGGGLWKPSQERCFGKSQLIGGLAEIGFGCRFDP